jgi:hypothetical protein
MESSVIENYLNGLVCFKGLKPKSENKVFKHVTDRNVNC